MKHCDSESKNKGQDELKTKATAGHGVQPTQSQSSSACQTTATDYRDRTIMRAAQIG